MGSELIHLGIVTSSLILLVVVPFLPVSFFLFRGQQWPKIVFSAMVLGCSVQASIGLLWSHLVGKWPVYELVVLGVIWMLMLLWSIWRAGKQNIVMYDLGNEPIQPALILILCIGFIIRSIHPVEVAYLGQSDAYTHLNYIHNIINFGHLINPVYPSGYHWVLALPSLVFSIDPYLTARFAGAFFGTGLVLGIYVLLDRSVNRSSALLGSFCAAAFPGMVLLMKTGVGSFANQFGLFLLPAIILFYILWVTDRGRNSNDRPLFLIALCGMAAAVPMMLLHVLLIIGLERLVMLVLNRRQWIGKTVQTVLLIIPALCLFAYHMSQVGAGHRFETAEIMTGYSDSGKKQSIAGKVADKIERQVVAYAPQKKRIVDLVSGSPYFTLLLDYLSVKRKGFGNLKLDLLGSVLAGLFLILLFVGMVRQGTSYIVIGIWGLLTSVQAGTGLFQFSSYQREGWSLLIATCCLSGIMAAAVYHCGQRYLLFRTGVLALMAASVVWTFLHPPIHFAIRSSAEDELVETIRFLGSINDNVECLNSDKNLCSLQDELINDLDVVLVTRRYVGWGNQGEIGLNVIPSDTAISVVIVDNRIVKDIFQPDRQYVVLIDKESNLTGKDVLGAFAMVTPSMVRATINSRKRLLGLNRLIQQQVDELSDSHWHVEHVSLSDKLAAYIVTPVGTI